MLLRLVTEYRRGRRKVAPGSVIQVSEADAVELIEKGIAVPLKDEAAVERR